MMDDTREVDQSTYFWEGSPAELALQLQEELGVTEDVVPLKTRYMQLTSFRDDDGEGAVNLIVTFYAQDLNVIDNFSL